MKCEQAIDLLVDFMEDSVTPEVRAGLEKHFADCPPCLEFFESYKKTSNLCRLTLMKQAPAELTSRLKSFLRQNCRNAEGGGNDDSSDD